MIMGIIAVFVMIGVFAIIAVDYKEQKLHGGGGYV